MLLSFSSPDSSLYDVLSAFKSSVMLILLYSSTAFNAKRLPSKVNFSFSLFKAALIAFEAKYIDIKFHYMSEAVETNIVNVQYCPTENMIADIFTESLARVKFEKFRDMLVVKE